MPNKPRHWGISKQSSPPCTNQGLGQNNVKFSPNVPTLYPSKPCFINCNTHFTIHKPLQGTYVVRLAYDGNVLIFVAIKYYNKEERARGMKCKGQNQNLVIGHYQIFVWLNIRTLLLLPNPMYIIHEILLVMVKPFCEVYPIANI